MNNNDRINAYKHAFNFKPEKLSSEEVAKNNAAIESQQKPKTDAALAALLSSSYQEPEKDEEKPEFKPFSFDNAPVFKSIDQGDGADEQRGGACGGPDPVAGRGEEFPAGSAGTPDCEVLNVWGAFRL